MEVYEKDIEQSLYEIYDEIDKDYVAHKEKLIESIDKSRQTLKRKFDQEVELRKNDIRKVIDNLVKIKDTDDLNMEKSKMLEAIIKELIADKSNQVGNEVYFSIFSFMNLDKNEEKCLKTLIGEVDEYKKAYQSTKFESFGRLFTDFQCRNEEDNNEITKILDDFTKKSRKEDLNRIFKKRIDNVFNTECLLTSKVNC